MFRLLAAVGVVSLLLVTNKFSFLELANSLRPGQELIALQQQEAARKERRQNAPKLEVLPRTPLPREDLIHHINDFEANKLSDFKHLERSNTYSSGNRVVYFRDGYYAIKTRRTRTENGREVAVSGVAHYLATNDPEFKGYYTVQNARNGRPLVLPGTDSTPVLSEDDEYLLTLMCGYPIRDYMKRYREFLERTQR